MCSSSNYYISNSKQQQQPQHPRLPCFHCHPHTYIRTVQHLIERCLLLHMTRDQCINVLSKHGIQPVVTLTVWRELLKENRSFFQSYYNDHFLRRPMSRHHIRKAPRFSRRKHY